MKNITTFAIVIALLLILFSSTIYNANAEAGTVEYHKAVVVWLDYRNNEFTVIDLTDGELWIYEEIEDWEIWDECIIEFKDGAPTGYIRYTGYCNPIEEGFITMP